MNIQYIISVADSVLKYVAINNVNKNLCFEFQLEVMKCAAFVLFRLPKFIYLNGKTEY